jgi:hypothetical protein
MTDDTNLRFSDDQRQALARVLDEIIPPRADGRLPGAGELGVAAYVEQALRSTPELRAMIVEGLTALDDVAQRRHDRPFAALSKESQSEVLNAVAYSEHAFPPVLLLHAYAGYYQDGRVMQVLGLEPRAPHPQGFAMEPNDLSLLDPVRERPKRYRDC